MRLSEKNDLEAVPYYMKMFGSRGGGWPAVKMTMVARSESKQPKKVQESTVDSR